MVRCGGGWRAVGSGWRWRVEGGGGRGEGAEAGAVAACGGGGWPAMRSCWSESRSRFSGLRSRCTTACWWQYSTPDTSCWNMTRACFVKGRFVKGSQGATAGNQRLWRRLARAPAAVGGRPAARPPLLECSAAQGHPARPEEAAGATLATEDRQTGGRLACPCCARPGLR